MKILVTGATGNVGSVVIEKLKAQGADVCAAVRTPKSDKAIALGVPLVPFDFTDPEGMFKAMQGFDRLFLILPLTKQMRVYGANAVAAAKAAGLSLVVRASSMGSDPNAHFQLGKIHGAVDADLEDSGIPFVILRPATFMQNYATYYAGAIKSKGKLLVPEREAKTSYVDLRDLGAVAAALLIDPEPEINKFYVVTGPQALDNHELAAIIGKVANRKVVYENIDVEDYGMGMEEAGLPEWNVHMTLSVHRYARSNYTAFKTKAVEYLTGEPAQSFQEFATEYAEVWK